VSVSEAAARRTPARPGPGPMPDALLRALDLQIRRKIEGLLPGDFQSVVVGAGTELAQVRQYEPGDDVRRIDWNVTARTSEPHVRLDVAEKALTTWILADISASMLFGTQDRRKLDVAEGVMMAVSYLATRRGNRVGIMPFGAEHWRPLPPEHGRLGLVKLLRDMWRLPPQEGVPTTSLRDALDRAARLIRVRGAIVVVSDFRGPTDWRRPLARLALKHDVAAVEIYDVREHVLPDVGDVWFMDPETKMQLRVDTRSRRTRERFAAAAQQERADVRRLIRASGVDHVALSTSGEWLHVLAAFLSSRRTRW
jgi:uncharacterized protein (DUF58 family)